MPAASHASPGDFLFKWGANQQFTDAGGVALDANGRVYVTDEGNVHVVNSSGIRIASNKSGLVDNLTR